MDGKEVSTNVEVTKWNAGWRSVGAILSALVLWIAATPRSLGAQALETHRREIIGGGLVGAVVGAVAGGVIGAQIRNGPAGG